MNLSERLIEARKLLTHVPKNGVHNLRSGSYEYVLADDVLGMCHKVFDEVGLDFQPEVINADVKWIEKNNNMMVHALVQCHFTFNSGEESQTSLWWGEASDYSDKAVAQAMTSATKYFLLKKFLIPSGENFADPDFDGETVPGKKEMKKSPDVEQIIQEHWIPLVERAEKAGVEVTPLPDKLNEAMLRTLYAELKERVEEAEK